MTLLYFAPVKWDSYPQRSHYFVEDFLKRHGGPVIWIDPYPIRLPVFRDLRTIAERSRLYRPRPAGFELISPRALPFEPVSAGRWLNRRLVWQALTGRLSRRHRASVAIGIGRPSSLALAALSAFRPARSFYDAMDDFPEFYRGISKQSVREHERRIVAAVDIVLTSSTALWMKFDACGPNRIMVPNAFEMAALPTLSPVKGARRVFGYVGCVGEWFDWPMTLALAQQVPDSDVRIVGPCASRPPRRLPPNVALFPMCPMPDVVEHLRHFSVGIIPFQRTPLTDAIDPIKYYAYRGMALPVLTTAFGEMRRRGIEDETFFMERHAGLAAATLAAAEKIDTVAVARFRARHTWEQRFEELPPLV